MTRLIHVEQPIQAPGPYQMLALAVIRQAADDYRILAKEISNAYDDKQRKRLTERMKSISRFFLSDWFSQLSGSDEGPMILEKLDEEVFGCD